MQISGQPDFNTLLNYRSRTDYPVPAVWIVLPMANYLVWAIFPWVIFLGVIGGMSITQLSPVLGVLGGAGLLSATASAYVVYMLANRRNTHFAREQALFGGVLAILRARVHPEDTNAQVSLASTHRYHAWLAESSGEKSAILQALLALIPYLGWVCLVLELLLLSDDWKDHEIREDLMVQELNRTLGIMGFTPVPTRLRPSLVRHRSTALLFVLSILTVGLVEIVWLYSSIGDPREHFEFHIHLEGSLASLSSLEAGSGGTRL